MEEKWWNGGGFGALFTDLSKVFDWLPHELLSAKIDAYGFDKKFLKLMHRYVSNRKQKVKINNKYSSWSKYCFCSTRVNFRTFVVQHFHIWYVLLCCSTFSYLICFTFLMTLILQIKWTTLHHTARVKEPSLLWINLI